MSAMSYSRGRRAILAGGASLLLAGLAPAAAADFGRQIAAMEAALGGRIGTSALDTGTGARLSHRGRERFAMCSSFKWLLAAAVLAHTDRGALQLSQTVPYSEKDLLQVSPVTQAHVGEGHLPIEELCAATVKFSDNAAANLLLDQIGGPQGVTAFLRSIGDPVTRLDRKELELNSNIPGDPRDTTMPDVMIGTMQTILLGGALNPVSREKLIQWLKDCATGFARLRAGLPKDWIVGDKTGTGFTGPCNDNAIAWPPHRAPILMVAYVDASKATAKQREAFQPKIAELIAQAFAG